MPVNVVGNMSVEPASTVNSLAAAIDTLPTVVSKVRAVFKIFRFSLTVIAPVFTTAASITCVALFVVVSDVIVPALISVPVVIFRVELPVVPDHGPKEIVPLLVKPLATVNVASEFRLICDPLLAARNPFNLLPLLSVIVPLLVRELFSVVPLNASVPVMLLTTSIFTVSDTKSNTPVLLNIEPTGALMVATPLKLRVTPDAKVGAVILPPKSIVLNTKPEPEKSTVPVPVNELGNINVVPPYTVSSLPVAIEAVPTFVSNILALLFMIFRFSLAVIVPTFTTGASITCVALFVVAKAIIEPTLVKVPVVIFRVELPVVPNHGPKEIVPLLVKPLVTINAPNDFNVSNEPASLFKFAILVVAITTG